MDQKSQIREALGELAAAAALELRKVDDPTLGPFGLTKALVGGLPREALVKKMPAFAGTWLDAFACEVQSKEGPGLFPAASSLTLKDGTDEQQATLRAGSLVCRGPNDDVLLLSPSTADAAVYVLASMGMHRLAANVAELVRDEVDRSLRSASSGGAAALPRFGFDDGASCENRAVLVLGRFFDAPRTQGEVKRVEALVRAWAARARLPIAYIHMGTTVNWVDDDDQAEVYESAPALIGLVVAHVSSKTPQLLARASIDASQVSQVPDGLWDELTQKHELTGREPGLYLAPAGWTVASIYDGSATYDRGGGHFVDAKPVLTTCAEDGTPGKRLEAATLPERFWLYATYA